MRGAPAPAHPRVDPRAAEAPAPPGVTQAGRARSPARLALPRPGRGEPLVMGVVNVTPDSFSDGGRFADRDSALRHGLDLVRQGAAILDVGGESTRPGAAPVSEQAEVDRVVPVIEALRAESPVPISIDTGKPAVMRAAVAAGADMINDVRALRAPGALGAAAALGVPVCVMHMQGEPGTMQRAPRYADVVGEVRDFLVARVAACREAGIAGDRLLIDPGFGFGKTLEHNLALLARLDVLVDTGLPVLVGLSRKAMLATLLGREVGERLPGSLALAVLAAARGASVIRVHDVAATLDAVRVVAAVAGAAGGSRG